MLCAEVENRLRELRGCCAIHQSICQRLCIGARELSARYESREHAVRIHIHDALGQTEREDAHCASRVGTYPRQGYEVVQLGGNIAAVSFHYQGGRPVERHGSARIAESPPRPQNVGARRVGACGRRRKGVHETVPRLAYAADRRLLEHHLADEDAPRTGSAPRQVACQARCGSDDPPARRRH